MSKRVILRPHGLITASPWPAAALDLEWGRKLYPPASSGRAGPGGLVFGLTPVAAGAGADLNLNLNINQPRGPVTSLKEEPLTSSQLAAARSWMQPAVDQTRYTNNIQFLIYHVAFTRRIRFNRAHILFHKLSCAN